MGGCAGQWKYRSELKRGVSAVAMYTCDMHRILMISSVVIFTICISLPQGLHAAEPITRRDGFLLLWNSISRPAESTREVPYIDVSEHDRGYREITYAKARGILNDENARFRPDEPLTQSDALLLLFRTRNIERLLEDGLKDFMELPNAPDVPALAKKYDLQFDLEAASLTEEMLLALMRDLDTKLAAEVHEASLYSEKFHGKGTAFGETFDMHALTAAHRSFPSNTLVRVRNIANGKTVVVRINDRGPFVQGRDMDLSLASFLTIAERSLGKINVTFERLGDINLVRQCKDDRLQRRVTKDVRLSPGIPHSLALGTALQLTSDQSFVIRDIIYPDDARSGVQTWVTEGETFEFTPAVVGLYRFLIGTKVGRIREMRMEVRGCTE